MAAHSTRPGPRAIFHGWFVVAAAFAVTFVGFGAEALFAKGKLVDLFPAWSAERFPMHAYYPSRHYLPAKTRALLDFVADLVGRGA